MENQFYTALSEVIQIATTPQVVNIINQSDPFSFEKFYEMRWSIKETIPITDGDWDNNGLISPGSFFMFEFGKKAEVDKSKNIEAKWIQFRKTKLE